MPPKQTKTPAESVQEMGKEITKEAIRKTVWNYLEDNDLVQFPRPVHHRIPNFMGAAAAAEKMASLDEFKRAQTVKINPDKPQENARFLTMEAEKTLLVPTPRLRHGLFNKLLPPEACGKEILRYCSTSQGLKEYSVPMGLEAKIKVDLVVIGSVAVTKTGFRIGKGEGFADLEYAMMCAMGAVNQDTIVVTTVHDSQVVDIPESLMEEHDVIVDYIVTDTEVIKCNKTRPKPTGVIWSKLTPEKVRQVPILKFLREKEREAGKDVTLKDGREEEDIPEREDRKYDSDMGRPRYGRNRRFRRFPRRGPPRQGRGDSGDYPRDSQENGVEDGNEEGDDDRSKQQRPRYRRNRRFRRRGGPRRREESDRYDESHEEDQDHDEDEERDIAQPRRRNMRRRRPRRRNESENTGDDEEKENRRPRRRRNPRSRAPIPTIFVGSIQRSVRVSELKTEIRGKDVNPIRVIWNGAKGYSLLQFQEMQEMESALDALQDLEIRGRKLRVEMSNRLRQGDDRESDQDDYANGAQAARPED